MEGGGRNKVKKTERRRESQRGERQTGRGRGKTGWKENSKRDLAFLTWGGGKEREVKKKEGGMGEGRDEEGDKRESLTWRQTAFQ